MVVAARGARRLAGEFEVQRSVAGLALEHGTIVGPERMELGESFHTRFTG